MKCEE